MNDWQWRGPFRARLVDRDGLVCHREERGVVASALAVPFTTQFPIKRTEQRIFNLSHYDSTADEYVYLERRR